MSRAPSPGRQARPSTLSHLTIELFNARIRTTIAPVAYRGENLILPDLLNNTLSMGFLNLPILLPLLTDIRMPGMDGLSLARCLIAMTTWRNAPEFVLVTGHAVPAELAGRCRGSRSKWSGSPSAGPNSWNRWSAPMPAPQAGSPRRRSGGGGRIARDRV